MIYARKVSKSFRKVIKIKNVIVNNFQNDIYLQFGNVDSYQDLFTKYYFPLKHCILTTKIAVDNLL